MEEVEKIKALLPDYFSEELKGFIAHEALFDHAVSEIKKNAAEKIEQDILKMINKQTDSVTLGRRVIMVNYDSLPGAIDKVLKDKTIDDKTKLERIGAYIEVFFDTNEQSLDDMI